MTNSKLELIFKYLGNDRIVAIVEGKEAKLKDLSISRYFEYLYDNQK